MSGEVDRAEWAKVVSELLENECRGNKSAFARRVIIEGKQLNVRTLYGWLRGEYDVKESSVRAVAAGFGIPPMELMLRIGFYSVEEMPSRPIDDVIDDEIALVLGNDELDDIQKMAIIKQLEAWRDEDKALQARLAERDKQRRVERLNQLIEQANRP